MERPLASPNTQDPAAAQLAQIGLPEGGTHESEPLSEAVIMTRAKAVIGAVSPYCWTSTKLDEMHAEAGPCCAIKIDVQSPVGRVCLQHLIPEGEQRGIFGGSLDDIILNEEQAQSLFGYAGLMTDDATRRKEVAVQSRLQNLPQPCEGAHWDWHHEGYFFTHEDGVTYTLRPQFGFLNLSVKACEAGARFDHLSFRAADGMQISTVELRESGRHFNALYADVTREYARGGRSL